MRKPSLREESNLLRVSEPEPEFWSTLFYGNKNYDVKVFKRVDEGNTTKVIVSFSASLRTRTGAVAMGLRQSEGQPGPNSV